MDGTSGDDNKSQQSSSTPMPQRKSKYIKSQQSSSVMTPQGKLDNNKPSGPSLAATTRQKRVDFERRMMFPEDMDPECFARYCSMQEKWAKADGFPDLADEIRKLSRIRAIFRIDSKNDRM